jgi:hypothetical protein
MLIPIKFASVNSVAELQPGIYRWISSVYANEITTIVVHEYSLRDALSSGPHCIDLFIEATDGINFVADFFRCSDGQWRDCHGLKSPNIEDLLPMEMAGCTLIQHFEMKDIRWGEL